MPPSEDRSKKHSWRADMAIADFLFGALLLLRGPDAIQELVDVAIFVHNPHRHFWAHLFKPLLEEEI